jgi:hypothetical protein
MQQKIKATAAIETEVRTMAPAAAVAPAAMTPSASEAEWAKGGRAEAMDAPSQHSFAEHDDFSSIGHSRLHRPTGLVEADGAVVQSGGLLQISRARGLEFDRRGRAGHATSGRRWRPFAFNLGGRQRPPF